MPSVEERLDRIERQIAELRESVAYLRGVVEQLDKRFSEFREYVEKRLEEFEKRLAELRDYVDRRFESIDRRVNHLETEIRELRNELNRRFLWLLGILISMWVTIIVAVLLK